MLFVAYVSDNWFGSLGMISAISLCVIILAKKKKLGFFGPMLENQIHKFQKGKRKFVVMGESVFLLFILGVMIFAIEQGNSIYSDLQVSSKIPSTITDTEILESTKSWNISDWFTVFLMTPVVFLTSFPQMSATIASIDNRLDGWLMHFYTVGFVEYLELLAIIAFYRISFNQKSKSPLFPTLYSKTMIQIIGNKFKTIKH